MTTATKKLRLIKQIAKTEAQTLIDQLGDIINTAGRSEELLAKLSTPVESAFDIEKVKAEQDFRPIDKEELNKLIQEADVQEPIEDLLELLRA